MLDRKVAALLSRPDERKVRWFASLLLLAFVSDVWDQDIGIWQKDGDSPGALRVRHHNSPAYCLCQSICSLHFN